MSSNHATTDVRRDRLAAWLDTLDGLAGARLQTASDDASFRRYFRVFVPGRTYIAMDAPPGKEDCRPFVSVARHLRTMALNAPDIVAADLDQGFLLMTDFGDVTYLAALNDRPDSETALYADALEALATLHTAGDSFRRDLPPYDAPLLRREIDLFTEWLLGRHLAIEFDEDDRAAWQDVSDRLVASALEQPRVFVHRDYHSRNLMVTADDNPGIIDFQDAMNGPLTYDLVSLLKDCYVTMEQDRLEDRITDFHERCRAAGHTVELPTFRRWFDLMGLQRHLKAAGIFARLNHRDGKSRYLGDLPRTLGYVASAARAHPEFAWLADLVERRCLPRLEGTE